MRTAQEVLDYRTTMRYDVSMTTTHLPKMADLDADALTAMGYPVEVRDKCVGVQVIVRQGTTLALARYLAWLDGKAQLSGASPYLSASGACPAWLDAAVEA